MSIENKNSNIHNAITINSRTKQDVLYMLKSGYTIEEITPVIISNNLYLEIIDIVNTEKSTIKYVCTKILRIISEETPQLIYPFYFEIAMWINHSNNFIKWDAIYILSNLASVDIKDNFDKIKNDYLNLIQSNQMITAANVVGNCWKFVISNPKLDSEITNKLLEVPSINYLHKNQVSPECNKIVCGKVIESFYNYFELSENKERMIIFVQNQLSSTRKSVVKIANKFLKEKTFK